MFCIPIEPSKTHGSTGWNPCSAGCAATNAVEMGSWHLLFSSSSAFFSRNCRETEAGMNSLSLLVRFSNTLQVTLTYLLLAVPT